MEKDWKKSLTPEEYKVLREKATERPFTGEYNDNKQNGIYYCKGCHSKLFISDDKFDSGSGWPSFTQPADKESVHYETDMDVGYPRTEVHCAKCQGHLGHVFDDGPNPTNKRYCINSIALKFEKK